MEVDRFREISCLCVFYQSSCDFRFHREYPALRSFMSRFLPVMRWLSADSAEYGLIYHVSEDGKEFTSYHDPTGEFSGSLTSAVEHDGYLYLGSVSNNFIGKLKL